MVNLSETPFISVIIPVYNGQDYLEETIKSVISQSYSNWELILIDDGSTDSTPKIIKDFVIKDKRIKYIALKNSSGGPAYPRNVGIEQARGDYIAFLDADDIWNENKLKIQTDYLKNTELDLLHCDAEYIDSMNNKYGIMRISIFYRILKTFFGSSFATLAINPIVLSSCVVKNSKDIQFRTDKTFHAIEDWFLWIDLSLKEKKFTKINQNLVSYRMHESSISKIDGLKQYLKGFNLYSALLLENKITINKYLILQFIHYLRILKYKVFGRNS